MNIESMCYCTFGSLVSTIERRFHWRRSLENPCLNTGFLGQYIDHLHGLSKTWHIILLYLFNTKGNILTHMSLVIRLVDIVLTPGISERRVREDQGVSVLVAVLLRVQDHCPSQARQGHPRVLLTLQEVHMTERSPSACPTLTFLVSALTKRTSRGETTLDNADLSRANGRRSRTCNHGS